MKSFRNCVIALLLGCVAPILVWAGAGVTLLQRKQEALTKEAPAI